MRLLSPATAALVTTAAVFAACSLDNDRVTGHRHGSGSVPSSLAFVNDPDRVDLDGMPDLIVDASATQTSWRVKDEFIPAIACSAEEGNVTAGNRRLLRFTVTTPNVGDADVFVGNPLDHMDPNGDGNTRDQDGMFEFASCHDHYHFKHYATYRLIDARTNQEWRAAKRGFCMLDTDPYNTRQGDGNRNYLSCGTTQLAGFQGISAGWADSYVWQLAGQYFVLDGGDGQAQVPPGDYFIEVHVNPPYAPDRRGNCPFVKDPATGQCHQFAESNYANNIGRARISIPAHPGRDGYGPLKGTADPDPSKELDKGV